MISLHLRCITLDTYMIQDELIKYGNGENKNNSNDI